MDFCDCPLELGYPRIGNGIATRAVYRTSATNAERSRHPTKDKQRLVVSVIAYESLPWALSPILLAGRDCVGWQSVIVDDYHMSLPRIELGNINYAADR